MTPYLNLPPLGDCTGRCCWWYLAAWSGVVNLVSGADCQWECGLPGLPPVLDEELYGFPQRRHQCYTKP